MKAKYYINKYAKDLNILHIKEDKKSLAKKMLELMGEFVLEIELLMKKRNTESTKALIGVLNELDNKWVSISNKIECLNKEGFRNYLNHISPDTLKIMNWNIK